MKNTRGSCALALLFLSDGKPSDDTPRHPNRPSKSPGGKMSTAQRQRHRVAGLVYSDAETLQARTNTISSRIGELAARFGRRLAVGTIGFAAPSEDFDVLQSLTKYCAAYECQASFHKPALTAHSLQQVLSHLSSTLTSTKTELTSLDGSSQRTVGTRTYCPPRH